MMNSEDLVKTIIGGFEDEIRSLIDLGVSEIRNASKTSLASGTIRIENNMSITVYSENLKLKVDNTKEHISVFNFTSNEENNIFDTILAVKTFAVFMTALKLKGFYVYRCDNSSVVNIRVSKEIDDSLSVLFNAIMKEVDLDEDTTK